MPRWRTDPGGIPVPEGDPPEPEPVVVEDGLTDHDVPAMRQHLPEYPDGPQDAAPDPGPEADEKAA